MDRVADWGRRNWFYLLLPVWAAAAFGFRAAHPWSEQPMLGEAVTLFDWCLFVPALYLLCYRDMPRRALGLRAIALVCGGIWIAGVIVPDAAENILTRLGPLRSAGIAILLLVEGVAILAILRVVFGATPDPAALERQGIPPPIARLMLAEARFWRWLWATLRGR